jgi:hypothetical protein
MGITFFTIFSTKFPDVDKDRGTVPDNPPCQTIKELYVEATSNLKLTFLYFASANLQAFAPKTSPILQFNKDVMHVKSVQIKTT